MRRLYIVGAIGFLLSIGTALLYLIFEGTGSQSAEAYVAGEAFKALLTFTVVALGGALIKRVIDASLDEQRAHRSLAEQRKERRTSLIREFVEIFSQFYSVRKLYESAFKHSEMYDKESKEYALLIKDLLKKSVDLEGRYGGFKILAINHFGLPESDLSTKCVKDIEKNLEQEQDIHRSIRLRLDLLGELYDDWRHAFEGKREIKVGRKAWENYEVLLKFLMETESPTGKPTGGQMDTDSIRSLRRAFESMEPPDLDTLVGTYRGEYVGPAWLRCLAGPTLGLTVLRGWRGKDFPSPGHCENLVSRGGTIKHVLPVDVVQAASLLDGRMGITLPYSPDSSRPYRWVVDELRLTSSGSLLGMVVPARGWLPRFALPFMLHPVDRES